MMLESTLDYEEMNAYTLTVTCVDAIDEGLTTTVACSVVVVDVAEAPILTGWSYTAGAISETVVRTSTLSVGTMTALDQDFNSGTSGTVISFAVRGATCAFIFYDFSFIFFRKAMLVPTYLV